MRYLRVPLLMTLFVPHTFPKPLYKLLSLSAPSCNLSVHPLLISRFGCISRPLLTLNSITIPWLRSLRVVSCLDKNLAFKFQKRIPHKFCVLSSWTISKHIGFKQGDKSTIVAWILVSLDLRNLKLAFFASPLEFLLIEFSTIYSIKIYENPKWSFKVRYFIFLFEALGSSPLENSPPLSQPDFEQFYERFEFNEM